jgi:hypothetical protein
MQFGLSWWFSMASVGSIIGIVKLRNSSNIVANQNPILVLAIVGMYMAYLAQSFGDFHSFLRVSREVLILILMSFVANRKVLVVNFSMIRKYSRLLLLISSFQLMLTILQFVLLQNGRWFGPPEIWFAGRGSLIPTNLDLIYSYIRPSGSFSEPSFLGIVCLTIIVISIPRLGKDRIFRIIFLISSITILISQSKSAILFLFIILIHIYRIFRGSLVEKIPVLFLGVLVSLALIYTQIFSRIQGSSSSEISINNRIFSPIKFVLTSISDHPFGTDFYGRVSTVLDLTTGLTWETILHNSIYNLIFSYGFFGFVVLVVILQLFRKSFELQVYLLALLLQNGSFLDFDKLFLVLVASVLYRQMRDVEEEQII